MPMNRMSNVNEKIRLQRMSRVPRRPVDERCIPSVDRVSGSGWELSGASDGRPDTAHAPTPNQGPGGHSARSRLSPSRASPLARESCPRNVISSAASAATLATTSIFGAPVLGLFRFSTARHCKHRKVRPHSEWTTLPVEAAGDAASRWALSEALEHTGRVPVGRPAPQSSTRRPQGGSRTACASMRAPP